MAFLIETDGTEVRQLEQDNLAPSPQQLDLRLNSRKLLHVCFLIFLGERVPPDCGGSSHSKLFIACSFELV